MYLHCSAHFIHLIFPLTASDSIALPNVNQYTEELHKKSCGKHLYLSNIHQSNNRLVSETCAGKTDRISLGVYYPCWSLSQRSAKVPPSRLTTRSL